MRELDHEWRFPSATDRQIAHRNHRNSDLDGPKYAIVIQKMAQGRDETPDPTERKQENSVGAPNKLSPTSKEPMAKGRLMIQYGAMRLAFPRATFCS